MCNLFFFAGSADLMTGFKLQFHVEPPYAFASDIICYTVTLSSVCPWYRTDLARHKSDYMYFFQMPLVTVKATYISAIIYKVLIIYYSNDSFQYFKTNCLVNVYNTDITINEHTCAIYCKNKKSIKRSCCWTHIQLNVRLRDIWPLNSCESFLRYMNKNNVHRETSIWYLTSDSTVQQVRQLSGKRAFATGCGVWGYMWGSL